MKKFTQETFLAYANEQALALKSDRPEVAPVRREALTKAIAVAQEGAAEFEVAVFKSEESVNANKTTAQTETIFDAKAVAPQAAKYDSAVAQNFDVLLGEASDMAKSGGVIEKRDLGLDDDGFPDDMNDPNYLKGKATKPNWDFDS